MRARIVWIVAALAVVAGVVWWLSRRGPERTETTRPHEGVKQATRALPGDAGPTPGPPRSVPPPTRRPLPPAGSPKPPEAADFDDDERDAAWAEGMEKDLGERLAALQVSAKDVECRARSCRLEVEAADTGALADTIARLEEPDGLAGVVDGIVVSAPEMLGGTGAVRTVIYTLSDR